MVSIVDDDDTDNAVLSATELEELYGSTLSNNESGDLILTADALMAPTSTDVTIKFVAAVSNDFTWFDTYENEKGAEYAEEIGETGDYEITKEYTLKITPITPAIAKISVDQTALGSKTDLGTYPVSEDKVLIWIETNYTSASSGDVLYATGFPAGLTFEMSKDEEGVVYVEVSDDCEGFTVPIQKYYYKLYGTPDKASSSTITITPQNYDYNVKGTARSGLKMTVLDKPSLTSPAEGKDLTSIAFDKTGYSQPLTLKGGDSKTYKPYVLTSAKYLPTFLTVSSNRQQNYG